MYVLFVCAQSTSFINCSALHCWMRSSLCPC
jgi:hypothetical protein